MNGGVLSCQRVIDLTSRHINDFFTKGGGRKKLSLVDRPALVDVLGETLVLVVGRALLVVDHVTDGPVHRGTLKYKIRTGLTITQS